MSIREKNAVERIREDYSEKPITKYDELKALDKKVRRVPTVFAYVFGSIGSLILGTGMCFAMKVIFETVSFIMPLGIGIGLIGIAMVSLNYFIYKKMLEKRKKKHAKEVLSLTEELLNK